MRWIPILALLLLLLAAAPVSAGHADAIATAQDIVSNLNGKTPLNVSLTSSQLTAAGLNSSEMLHPDSTYAITIKSVSYNASTGELITYINGYRDGNSLHIHNPVRWYMPFVVTGTTGAKRLAVYELIVIQWLDRQDLGQPVNDDTLVVFPSNDGYTQQGIAVGDSWTNLKNGPGNSAANQQAAGSNNQILTSAHASANGNYTGIRRGMLTFNASAIGAGTVTAAVLRTKYYSKAVTLGGQNESAIVGASPANASSYVAGDFDSYGTTEFASRFDFTSKTSGDINYTLNAAGLSYIKTDGSYTVFGILDGDEIDGTFTGSWASSASRTLRTYGMADATEANRPYLEIIYTPGGGGDTTPPLSVTFTGNTTNCSQSNITWTKPGDADFNHTYALWQNTWVGNLSNSTTYLLKTGLSASTTYTLSTRTVDLTGNMNATWTNYSVTTTTCGDTTPPSSITGLTNTSVTCNQLFFNWTNPLDADYGGLMVWRNNTALTNLSGSATGVSWGGLPGGTAITFSSKTFDTAGNANATFVNMTKITDACGSAPVAAFSANDTSVCPVDWIKFTDSSTNSPTSWNWSFGDGNVSSVQSPTKNFNITGTYTINLTVSNAFGSDSEVKTNYITVTDCAVPTPTPTTPVPTLPAGCTFLNITGATVLANSTNLSMTAGQSSWGVTILNRTQGNISYFQCGASTISTGGSGSGGGEGAAIGLISGLIGAIIFSRGKDQ